MITKFNGHNHGIPDLATTPDSTRASTPQSPPRQRRVVPLPVKQYIISPFPRARRGSVCDSVPLLFNRALLSRHQLPASLIPNT